MVTNTLSHDNQANQVYEFVPELYGTWTPQNVEPYEVEASKSEYPQLIEIGSVVKSGDMFTVNSLLSKTVAIVPGEVLIS